jgi:hypothetical protein
VNYYYYCGPQRKWNVVIYCYLIGSGIGFKITIDGPCLYGQGRFSNPGFQDLQWYRLIGTSFHVQVLSMFRHFPATKPRCIPARSSWSLVLTLAGRRKGPVNMLFALAIAFCAVASFGSAIHNPLTARRHWRTWRKSTIVATFD